jgi:hypothetical protein
MGDSMADDGAPSAPLSTCEDVDVATPPHVGAPKAPHHPPCYRPLSAPGVFRVFRIPDIWTWLYGYWVPSQIGVPSQVRTGIPMTRSR